MIELFSTDAALIRLVREAASGVCELEVVAPLHKDLPRRFDVAVTRGRLDAGVEKFAAQRGAPFVVVMPEAGDWLASQGKRGRIAAVGADYRQAKF